MKKLLLAAVIWISIITTGCTDNQMARQYGGSMTEDLPAGRHLSMVTWKDSDMWILTRQRHADEKIETYDFTEKSNLGVLQGTVHIVEH